MQDAILLTTTLEFAAVGDRRVRCDLARELGAEYERQRRLVLVLALRLEDTVRRQRDSSRGGRPRGLRTKLGKARKVGSKDSEDVEEVEAVEAAVIWVT